MFRKSDVDWLQIIKDQYEAQFNEPLDIVIEEAISAGEDPSVLADSLAAKLKEIEVDVIDVQPDKGHFELLRSSDISDILEQYIKGFLGEKEGSVDGDPNSSYI